MKTDRPAGDASADATAEWLSGLAGRPGAGPMHAEGGRVRGALQPDALDAPKATWRDITMRAGLDSAASARPDRVSEPAAPGSLGAGAAANEPSWRRRFGLAAALMVGLGLVTLMSISEHPTTPALRGVDGRGVSGPQWLVEQPGDAAEALATELRGLKAEVIVTREGEGVMLDIRAQHGAIDAVNARLAPLETGLDPEGRLRLAVLPIR